jgi:hypothetical protein
VQGDMWLPWGQSMHSHAHAQKQRATRTMPKKPQGGGHAGGARQTDGVGDRAELGPDDSLVGREVVEEELVEAHPLLPMSRNQE